MTRKEDSKAKPAPGPTYASAGVARISPSQATDPIVIQLSLLEAVIVLRLKNPLLP
jgi:hypothetical protein